MCIMQSVCENATAKRHLLKVRFGFISIQFFFGFCFRNERVHQQRQEANGARSIEPYGSIYCNIVWCCCTGLHPPTHEVAMHIIIIMVESVFGCACGPICAAHVRESMPTRMLWIIIVRAYRGGRWWSSRVCVCLMHKNILSSVPHCHMCVRRSQPSRHYSGFSIYLLQCFAFFFTCIWIVLHAALFFLLFHFSTFHHSFSRSITIFQTQSTAAWLLRARAIHNQFACWTKHTLQTTDWWRCENYMYLRIWYSVFD